MHKTRLLILGPVPPPYGGVSVYIRRFCHLMQNRYSFDFVDEYKQRKPEYFNIRSKKLGVYLRKMAATEVAFIHSGVNNMRILHLVMSRLFLKRSILMLHSYPGKKSPVKKWLDEFFYGLANEIIVVNADILERMKLPAAKVSLRNAFLPPIVDDEPRIPGFVEDWINLKKSEGKTILTANASKLAFYKNQDLYGLDLCITLLKDLRSSGEQVAFVYNVSDSARDILAYSKYQQQIQQLGLSDDFLLINEPLSFIRLMLQSDIILRPTNTDGDSITVREALFLGKTILASDVVNRPEGTVLFRSRDSNSLAATVKGVLDDHRYLNNGQQESLASAESHIMFYSKLIEA